MARKALLHLNTAVKFSEFVNYGLDFDMFTSGCCSVCEMLIAAMLRVSSSGHSTPRVPSW